MVRRWQGDVALEVIAVVQGRHPDEYVFRTKHANPWRYDDFHSDRAAAAMARELLRAKDAIVPGGYSQDQIDARPVRTRPRRRSDAGADLRSAG